MRHLAKSRFTLLPVVIAVAIVAVVLAVLGPRSVSRAQGSGESPCIADYDNTVSPSTLNLGESATITLRVRAVCPTPIVTRHIVLVLDATGSMTGTPRALMIDAASEFVRGLTLARNPATRVGLVEFNNSGRTLSALTGDEADLLAAIAGVGATSGSRIDLGITEGMSVLRDGRNVRGPILEVMVLLSDGGNNAGCEPVRAAALRAKAEGVLVLTSCLGAGCDEECMRSVASDASDVYYRAADPTALADVFQGIGERIRGIGVKKVTVTDTLPDQMRFIPGSAEPPQTAPGDPDQWVKWESDWLPRDGVTFTFRVEPLAVGHLATNLDASGEVIDPWGRTRSWTFDVPFVTVVDPDATPGPPERSLCVGGVDVRVQPASVAVGETVTVSHRASVGCPDLPLHLVLVLDGSSTMAGEPRTRMISAARALVASLALPAPDYSAVRVGVVEFNSAATMLVGLTTDPAAVDDAIARVGATDGARIDVGILEGIRVLRQGRASEPGGGDEPPEVIVVMTRGDSAGGCMPVTMAAEMAKGQGMLVVTVADCPGCDETCVAPAATSPRHALRIEDADALRELIRSVRDRTPEAALTELSLQVVLAPDMTYVPGSAVPALETEPDADGVLRWRASDVPGGAVNWTLQLRPGRAGVLSAFRSTTLHATDWQGRVADVGGGPGPDVIARDSQGPSPTPTLGPPRPAAPTLYLPIAVRQTCIVEPRPINVVFVIDVSSSMGEPSAPGGNAKLTAAKDAARTVVRALDLELDAVAVVTTDTVQPLARDLGAIEGAIDRVAIDPEARLDSGLHAGYNLLEPHLREDAFATILALTDGREEPQFPSSVIAAADRAKAAGIVLIVLAIGDDADTALLARVASTPDLFVRSAETAAARMRWIRCADVCPGWPGR